MERCSSVKQIAEHRPHGLKHGLGIGGRRGVAFQVLGLGEGELQLLGQRLGEVAAAQRNAPLPHAIAVADHQVGGVGAQRDDHHRLGRILGIVLIGRRQFAQLVEAEEVVEHQRRKLDDVDLDVGLDEGVRGAEDGVALHGEQADLGLQGEPFLLASAAHPLIVPDDVVEVEGDLLPGFVADDVGDFLGFDRRQLDESRQARLARHGNGHPVAQHRVPREELLQGVADQFGGVGTGLAEDLGIFDVVEGVGDDPLAVFVGATSQGLQRTLADINAPNSAACHICNSSVDASPTWRKDPAMFSVPDSPRPEAGLSRCDSTRLPISIYPMLSWEEGDCQPIALPSPGGYG